MQSRLLLPLLLATRLNVACAVGVVRPPQIATGHAGLLPHRRVETLFASVEALLSASSGARINNSTPPAILHRARARARARLAGYGPSFMTAAAIPSSTAKTRISFSQTDFADRSGHLRGRRDSEAESLVLHFSSEILALQDEVDVEHDRCQAERDSMESRSRELRRAIDKVGARTDLLDSQVSRNAGQMAPSESQVESSREELTSAHEACHAEHGVLQARQSEAEEELRRAQQLRKKIEPGCHVGGKNTGKITEMLTLLSLRRKLRKYAGEAERRGSLSSSMNETGIAISGFLQMAPDLSRPEPAPPADMPQQIGGVLIPEQPPAPPKKKHKTRAYDARVLPNCEVMLDSLEEMERTASERVSMSLRKLHEHQERCRHNVFTSNDKVDQQVAHLTVVQSHTTEAVAAWSQARNELIMLEQEMHSLAGRVREMQASCTDALQRLEDELCSLIEQRQAVYWLKVNDDPTAVIEDCEVGDWAYGFCSKTCSGAPGEHGVRTRRRPTLFMPDRTQAVGAFGAGCPTKEQAVGCAEEACPVDCEMGAWSEWAACSKQCGGGEQLRTRHIKVEQRGGGRLCDVTVESRRCNTGGCRQECTLGDWSSWSTCSRQCRWSPELPPGRASRTRPVVEQDLLDDRCPGEADRTEYQACNDFPCQAEVNCSTDQDIVLLLDGSGSTLATDIDAAPSKEGANFGMQKSFVEKLVDHSVLLGDGAGSNQSGARFGVVVYGGDGRPHVASMLTGLRSELLKGLQSSELPKGETQIGPAFQAASQLFRLGTRDDATKRQETVVLVTDGKSLQPELIAPGVERLRDEGVQIMAVLVLEETSPMFESAAQSLCGLTGGACPDHVLTVDRWTDLTPQLNRFLAAICNVA